jgi:hypothetical protein
MAADPSGQAPPPLDVTGDAGTLRFDRPFRVGRDAACEVRFEDHARVSRLHLEVRPEGGVWWAVDLGSANGLLVDGARGPRAPVAGALDVQVGEGGPRLRLSVAVAPPVGRPPDVPAADETRVVDVAALLAAGASPDAAPVEPPALVEPLAPVEPPALVEPPARPASSGPTPPEPAAPRATAESGTSAEGEPLSYEKVVERYFTADDDDDAGERTRFIRQAYIDIQKATETHQKAQHSRYRLLVGAALLVAVIALGYAGYREITVRQLRAEAESIFFQLRTVDVSIAQQVVSVEQQIEANPEDADSLRALLDQALAVRRETAARYDRFVRGLGVYDGLSSEEEAIYRVARAFGESELSIPPEFVAEVKVYVNQWRRSNRFQTAVRTAQVNGYVPIAVDALRRNGLPPEFFYLALQESNFDTRIVGPWTRYGHAKGAWQFIPETGRRYGLRTGPLVNTNQYDPLDERHDFDAAADAAARYLHDIYTTLAQASGLLVCASYNWGEHRVKSKMNGIRHDPAHRTYWRFLTEYRSRMPDETRGYVMNIFAAAVIGQNPRMFGIDMDPPLAAALAGGGGIRDANPDDPSRPRSRMGSDALGRR